MKTKIYIDKAEPFVSSWPEKLTDGSEVWNLHFRGGDVIHCLDEKRADVAMTGIAIALNIATGEEPLVI
jgi:hypothetical protein